jgi:hypothetical protein
LMVELFHHQNQYISYGRINGLHFFQQVCFHGKTPETVRDNPKLSLMYIMSSRNIKMSIKKIPSRAHREWPDAGPEITG